jgi:hypothetical protein
MKQRKRRTPPRWFAPTVLVSAVATGGILGLLFALAAA